MIWSVVLKKTFESLLDSKEIQPVYPKGNQSWIFTGRTDAEAETPVLWPPDAKNWLLRKVPDAGKDWRQEEKGTTEDEMVEWHHWLNGHEFEQALGGGDRQESLVCCSPWVCKELDTTEWLNWTELNSKVDGCYSFFQLHSWFVGRKPSTWKLSFMFFWLSLALRVLWYLHFVDRVPCLRVLLSLFLFLLSIF